MHPRHPIALGAPREMGGGARPALLQRDDDDFIASTLDDLRSSGGRVGLRELLARATADDGRTLKLYQPIQRQFHVALTEAWCDIPGTPRLDPASVDSAGLVLRRLDARGRPEGWMRSKGRARGWIALTRIGGDSLDPGSAGRLTNALTGVAGIDRQLSALALQNADNQLDEDVVAMYLAPPDVCADAGKTLFYGIVPTTSSELSEVDATLAPAGDDSFGPQSALFRSHLVEALRGDAMDLPFPGEVAHAGWFDALEAVGDDAPAGVPSGQSDELKNAASDNSRRMRRFLLLLRQLATEFDAFGGAPEAADLIAQLHAIELPLVRRGPLPLLQPHVRADVFLAKAVTLLLEKGSIDGDLEMPASWPALASDRAARLASAMHVAMQARFNSVQTRSGRFDEPNARYVVRAFVRLKADGACPSRVVWSDYSPPFVIAPWYDGAGAPPVQIPLPDPSNRKLLKALKPNVAFVVPPAMQNLLSGSAKDLMEGKGSTGTLGITWICSFSIPIITICAFLVLNIFLTLFNIVFGWMFFLKICIPFPKFGNKPPGS